MPQPVTRGSHFKPFAPLTNRADYETQGTIEQNTQRYPGSDEYRVGPFPLVNASFRDRVYLGPISTGIGFALGAYPIHGSHVRLAVELGVQNSRRASRADALAGMEDRAVATPGVNLSYRTEPSRGSSPSQWLTMGAGLIQTTRAVYSGLLGEGMLRLRPGRGWRMKADAAGVRQLTRRRLGDRPSDIRSVDGFMIDARQV